MPIWKSRKSKPCFNFYLSFQWIETVDVCTIDKLILRDLIIRFDMISKSFNTWVFLHLFIDFCYTWIPSLAHVHPNSILLDLAKHVFTIIFRLSKNKNFSKIWRLWLKNCACHAHFNFELLKGVAVLFFEIYPWNFDHLWIFYRQKNDVLFIFLHLQ